MVTRIKTKTTDQAPAFPAEGVLPAPTSAPGNSNARAIDAIIRNTLFPLAAPYFAYDQARNYFARDFADDITVRASAIPDEDIATPRAFIAGPLLHGLSLAYEEPALRSMYLGLLVATLDTRRAAGVHPGFAEIVRQLAPEETPLLSTLLLAGKMPLVELTIATAGKAGYRAGCRHLLDFERTEDAGRNRRLGSIVPNWARLGLAEIDYTQQMARPDAYDWVKQRPEYRDIFPRLNGNQTVEIITGVLRRTDYGRQFGEAAGLVEPPA